MRQAQNTVAPQMYGPLWVSTGRSSHVRTTVLTDIENLMINVEEICTLAHTCISGICIVPYFLLMLILTFDLLSLQFVGLKRHMASSSNG